MRKPLLFNTKLSPLVLAIGLSSSLSISAHINKSTYEFNLTSQPLSYALNIIAKQANMNLIADSNALKGLTAPAVSGEKTLTDALIVILQGTTLRAQIIGNNIVIKTDAFPRKKIQGATSTMHNEQSKHGHSDDIEVIVVKGEKLQLDRAQIDRSSGLSNSDIFSTFAGIEANNIRNEAGALDIGIRGVQGEGRVPIFIDGSLQSTHTSRGYMGTADRTYIDSDLISTVDIEKGATTKASPFGAGAIGGTVDIKTLSAFDILKPNTNFGALIKIKAFNNNKMPKIPDNAIDQSGYRITDSLNTGNFQNGSFMFASAFKQEDFSAVLAISEKKVGNYFAGSNGHEDFIQQKGNEFYSFEVRPPVNKNAEVVNTSFESSSYLAKISYKFNEEHKIEVNARHHQQKAGEMLASYWHKYKAGDYLLTADGDWYQLPEGEEAMPQWQKGTAHVNSLSANYQFLPANNPWIDLKVNLWTTNANLNQYNALGSNLGKNALQYLHEYKNKRAGASAYNVAAVKIANKIPAIFTTGYAWQSEELSPKAGYEDKFFSKLPTSRHGERSSNMVFANFQLDWDDLELTLNVNLHDAQITDHQTDLTQSFSLKTDTSLQLYYQLLENTKLSAKYSSAYRMPSLYEATVSNEVFSYSPDYPIGPEKTDSYDIGIKSFFTGLLSENDSLTISANYFHTELKDMIATADLPSAKPDAQPWDRTYAFTNYDVFELPGTEFAFNYKSDVLYASATLINYQAVTMCSNTMASLADAERCNNIGFLGSLTPLRIPPEKSFIATLGLTLFNDTLDSGFIYKKHTDKRHPGGFLSGTAVDALEYIPAGYQLDFYTHYTFNTNTTGYLSVTNLTDQYKVSSGSIVALPEPGQTITLGLEIKL